MNLVNNNYVLHARRYQPENNSEVLRTAPQNIHNTSASQTDSFKYSNPSFTSVCPDMKYLRKYAKELGNAYSDAKYLTDETYNYLMSKIKSASSDAKAVQIADKYSPILDEIEEKVFKFLKNSFKETPQATLKEVIEKQLPVSYNNLAGRYKRIVKDLSKIVNELPKNTKLSRRYEATIQAWLTDLETKNYDAAIGSGKYEQILEKMHFPKTLSEQKGKIKESLKSIPKAEDDIDAFLIRYKDVNRRVMFKRLLEPFVVNIEHIIPRGKGGHANSLSNVLLVRTKDNSKRATNDLIEGHPERGDFIRSYFKRVIDAINNGKMKEILWYPFEIKNTIEEASHNTIKLDNEIAKLKISQEEAYKNFFDITI